MFNWSHTYRTRTEVPAQLLWPVVADVARWPEIDANIASLTLAGPAGPGQSFTLRPKGGPALRFTIGEFTAPGRYSDICHLFGATMTTLHTFRPGTPTEIQVDITIAGPLAWFWGLVVGRQHAAGLPAQTERLVRRAQELAQRAA